MKNKKGISLIVLVITILVMVILAGVVVVNMSENNPITKAKEARFKEDLTAIGSELDMFVANKLAENASFSKRSLNANKNSCNYNTKTDAKENSIAAVLPSIRGTNHEKKVEIINGNLFYRTNNKVELAMLKDIGIHFSGVEAGTITIKDNVLVSVSPDYVSEGTLVIPENVTEIADGAFAGCVNIVDVVLPSKITKIGPNTFRGCSELVSIDIPNSVTEIGQDAFKQCWKLKNINFPTELTKIGYGAFHECVALTSVDLSNTKLKTIGEFAFYYCTGVSTLKFNEGLETIGNQSFQAIIAKDIVVPNNVKIIKSSAFIGNHNLETISIGPNTNIEASIVRACPALKSFGVVKSNKYEVVDNILYAIDENGEKHLQEAAASVGQSTKGVIDNLPADLKYIDYGAFLDNDYIKSVTLPDNVKAMYGRTFEGCKNLTKVVMPRGINEISARIFENAIALKDISFKPDSTNNTTETAKYKIDNGVIIDKLNKQIIASINNKTTYKIPADITRIGAFAFTGCTSLESIDFSEALNLTSIGEYAFLSCQGLIDITIPNTVTAIEHNLFNNCTKLETVKLSENVTVIPMLIFNGCTSLKTVTMSAKTTDISGQAFRGTTNFSGIKFSGPNQKYKIIDGNIYTDGGRTLVAVTSGKKDITIPNGVTKLGRDSLRGYASGITSVSLPNTLVEIGRFAFEDLGQIKRIVIPSSVTTIDSMAFDNTPQLVEIIVENTNGSIQGSPWGATKGTGAVKWTK